MSISGCRGIPLFYLVIAVVCLFNMTCRHISIKERFAAVYYHILPVFIITCVVARFTFFLNPARRLAPQSGTLRRSYIPAHDILMACLRLNKEYRRLNFVVY